MRAATLFFLVFVLAGAAGAQKHSVDIRVPSAYQRLNLRSSATLQAMIDEAVRKLTTDKLIEADKIAVTLIDLRDPAQAPTASYRGDERIYPASVIKLFYLAAIERQLEDKQVRDTPELQRGIHDMIVNSSNEATQYILDVITGTSSGAELQGKDFDAWQYKRDRVNRWFTGLGYTNINANQKTVCEDAYGIEHESRALNGGNLNALTTNATARLLSEIVLGRVNTVDRTAFMKSLLSRDWAKPSNDTDDQATGFTGRMLIDKKLTGARLWSKAGWTSTTRHDAAYIETPNGLKFVLVTFTQGHATDRAIIPTLAGHVLEGLEALAK